MFSVYLLLEVGMVETRLSFLCVEGRLKIGKKREGGLGEHIYVKNLFAVSGGRCPLV
jgi:hypothetical protein